MKIPRDKYLQELQSVMHNGMIKIITGVRRCGKSYLLFELFKQSLLDNGVNEDHVIQVDLENRRSKDLRNPDTLLDYIDGHIVDNDMYYILLDEIQLVPEFEDVLNSYLKIKNADVYVTGSNSRMLSSDVKTEFRGRGYEIRVHPLSFSEFLKTGQYASELNALQDYMIYGGMPQIVSFSDKKKKENYLKSLFQGTYIRDIKERYNIRNDDDLNELIDIIASNIGCLTNPTNLENTFKSVKEASVENPTRQALINYALQFIGNPYVWGGTTPYVGLDCSGLVQYCYRQAGKSIPRTSGSILAGGTIVSDPQPGDICWTPGHVAIYIGNGQMIEAQQTGVPVKVSKVRVVYYVRY